MLYVVQELVDNAARNIFLLIAINEGKVNPGLPSRSSYEVQVDGEVQRENRSPNQMPINANGRQVCA